MSNPYAIASVTAVLQNLLRSAASDQDFPSVLNASDVPVTAVPPDRVLTDSQTDPTQLNLFLYRVAPNQGWRNVDLPSRDARGQRLTNKPLALDLYYLLTAYASTDVHSEILLGFGMQVFHENPVLPRDTIRNVLTVASLTDLNLPTELGTSNLAEQVEQIKLTIAPISSDEISKLWTAFQTNYRPSVAYHASVVLIEGHASTRSPLPVRARNLYVRTFQQPEITEIRSQANAAAEILPNQPILPGHRLVIVGSQLSGEDTIVRIGGIEVQPLESNQSQIIVSIPPTLSAGVHGVQVIQRISMGTPPEPHLGSESNVCAFVLRPEISGSPSVSAAQIENDVVLRDIQLTVNPEVGDSQRVVLLLNEWVPETSPPAPPQGSPAQSYSFRRLHEDVGSPPGPSNTVVIETRDVDPGEYLVRVQIDGAESLLTTTNGRYDSPRLTIP